MLKIKTFTFGPFQENTYLLSEEGGDAIIVDPGCYDAEEREILSTYIAKNDLKLIKLLNTHGHIDHVFGNRFIHSEYDLLPELHKDDLWIFQAAEKMAHLYNLNYDPSPEPEVFLSTSDEVKLGSYTFKIKLIPGHSPGHIVFYEEDEKILLGGDVLFRESIGRTDLPGGDHQTLLRKIKEELYTMSDDFKVFPGHGMPTTLGHEKEHNPFVKA